MRALLLLALVLAASPARAAPPADVKPDAGLAAWFKSLRQPGTAMPCCSIADCRFTSYLTRGGHYEVDIEGQHLTVPDADVIRDIANPNFRAVVCYTYEFGPPAPAGTLNPGPQDPVLILCFVPPTTTS